MKGEKLSIGVCGIGSIGSRHARLLSKRPDVNLYLCDPVASHLQSVKDLANLSGTTDTFEKMLDWELDGIVIATPEHLHVPQGIAACRQGIAVLLEKPIAETVEQAKMLLETVRETGVKVLVGYILRYAECFLLAKSLMEQGLIGTPVSFQIMLGAYETLMLAKNRFSPSDRDKLFGDFSHEWDYLHWFLGPVRNVVATSHQSGNLELVQRPNVVDAILELESGVTGTAHLDYVQLPGMRRFTIIGDRGTLETYAQQCLVTTRLHGEEFSRSYHRIEHRDAMMDRQLEHFTRVIRGVEKQLVTVEDGIKAVGVAEALILSCQTRNWQTVS